MSFVKIINNKETPGSNSLDEILINTDQITALNLHPLSSVEENISMISISIYSTNMHPIVHLIANDESNNNNYSIMQKIYNLIEGCMVYMGRADKTIVLCDENEDIDDDDIVGNLHIIKIDKKYPVEIFDDDYFWDYIKNI